MTTPRWDLSEDPGERNRQVESSGIIRLFDNQSMARLVDALLDCPPDREFNKTEFAEVAGVTRQTVGRYIDILLETEVIEQVPDSTRYRVTEGPVMERLRELNKIVQSKTEG